MAIQNEIIKVVAQVELDDQGRAEAAEGLKKLNNEYADLRKEIEKTEVEMTKLAAAGKKDSQEFKDLGKHLNQTKDQLKANTKLANQHARALGLNHMTYNQLKAHASKLRKELNSLHKETEPQKWEQYNEELVATEKRMKEVKGGMENCGDGLARLQSILGKHKGLLSVLGLAGKVLSSVFKQMTEQTQVWGDKWQMTVTKVKAGWNQFIANIGQGKDVIKASVNDAIKAAADAQLLVDELFERENSTSILTVKLKTEINELMGIVKDVSKSDDERYAALERYRGRCPIRSGMTGDGKVIDLSTSLERSLFLEATDRLTARAIAAVRRMDEAIVVEVQVEHAVAARRNRPVVAVATDNAEASIVVIAITRSWIPRCGRR